MVKFVGVCVVLFVVAAGFIVLGQAQDMAALFAAFRAESLTQKLAWFIVAISPLVLIPTVLWLCDALLRQRKANDALELRLGGVRQGTRELTKAQIDADAAAHHLARTDPESALGSVAQRLAEAESTTAVQERRNQAGDLQSRVDELRALQEKLRERLVPALEKRRSIEQLFTELDNRESDIDRALAEIAGADDITAIDLHLKNLAESIRVGHERCDQIDEAAKTVAGLKDDFAGLRTRLTPHAAAKDGIQRRLKDLDDVQERLATDIGALQQTPQGSLAARVQAFADDRKKLDDGVADLDAQFSRLTSLRKDADALSANFDRVLDLIATSKPGANGADARIAELSQFIKATQTRFDEVDRSMTTAGQLKVKLGDLQARLLPLESANGGVADLLAQVADIRDRLVAKIERIEADENGNLAARVDTFIQAKQELEKRVSTVTEHFSQLATIRNDIAGLFDKLSNAADTSSN